ncbi:MAG: endonuclease/exonuclease/phosphatase family protein [Spirochaetaceae bacterium]|jgi:endonuclease/exonuclease/phosphatase family metal-dependent hydrolase|nr:endonuclease/exonuclease/phosphatase family protein [Spirochaetaceae bacterium]
MILIKTRIPEKITIIRKVLFAAALIFSAWGCTTEKTEAENQAERLTIVSWNVLALFDGNDDGFEYPEYKGDAGWNSEKYQARLNEISGAVMDGLNPDILALVEVENYGVMQNLAEHPKMDYHWFFFANAPGASLGVGVLSRFPLIETKAHSVHFSLGNIPRPVAEVRVDTGSGPLVLFVCHWKSKLGGEKQTELMRRAAAGIIARRIEEIAAEDPSIPVIVMGDLNENYDEFTRIGGAYICALLPDTGEAAELAAAFSGSLTPGGLQRSELSPGLQDFLIVSGQKPPEAVHFNGAAVYSPWLDYPGGKGSYHYKDDWETIDHFLLNSALFDEQGWEYENFNVFSDPPFTRASGIPYPYNPKTGNGLSDHLPIVLTLSQNHQGFTHNFSHGGDHKDSKNTK